MAATSATTSRPSRWPWIVFVGAAVFAAIGLVFVSLNGYSLVGDVTNFTAFMGIGVVGALTLSRAPNNRIGWLMLWVAITVGVAFTTGEVSIYAAAHGWPSKEWWAWPGNVLWTLGLFPLLILLPLLFPDGRLPSPRWRWLLWAGLGISFLAFVSVGFGEARFDVGDVGATVKVANPLHVPALGALGGSVIDQVLWPVLLGLFVVSAGSMFVRFRRSSGVERQQLKWFAFAAIVLAAYFVVSAMMEALGIGEGSGPSEVLSGLAFLGIPVAVGVSILQYRLWELDVVVKKALVAGALVVLALGVYAAAVTLFGVAAADRQSPGALFVIALLLGIAFRPVMRIARRVVDRFVYGRRATPYEVLTEFSERVGTSYATEDVLPRMAQVLGEGAGAEVARVWLRSGRELRQAAAWPAHETSLPAIRTDGDAGWGVEGETAVEVRDRGELLGALSVRMPAADPMSPTKEKLVRDLAAQAGLVLRNVRLVEDLRASRQRLVAAQDEERRRLERNIHDGAQQQLVALAVKARLARQLTERDPTKTAEMLVQIEVETQTALEDLRDLARGIYPPLLADRGLVAALEAQSRKASLPVRVEAGAVGRYSADVEATVYFCALEALQNVAKYADADATVIRLSQTNGSLSFEVVDQGRGFDPDAVATGSGLQGMADRLAAVGGSLEIRSAPGEGTTVAGRVPVHAA
jgi:signal transduction histidine kinase